MEQNASKPVHYVVAFDNDKCVKDVTVRYASDWLITTRKLRISSVDQHWWKQTLNPFKTTNQVIHSNLSVLIPIFVLIPICRHHGAHLNVISLRSTLSVIFIKSPNLASFTFACYYYHSVSENLFSAVSRL